MDTWRSAGAGGRGGAGQEGHAQERERGGEGRWKKDRERGWRG
jgi:hypothetical protein